MIRLLLTWAVSTFNPDTDPNPATKANDHFAIIIYAIVGCFAAICTLAGIVIPLVLSARNKAAEAKYEVTNDHDKPLRNDLDDKHGEIVAFMGAMVGLYNEIKGEVTEIAKDVGHLTGRVTDIEDTQDRKSNDKQDRNAGRRPR